MSDYTESAKIVQSFFVEQIEKYFPDHVKLASSVLPTEEVMNPLKKRQLLTDDNVVHIS